MNLLVVLENSDRATFYVVKLNKQSRELIRINPYGKYFSKSNLVQLYFTSGINEIAEVISKLTMFTIDRYIILNQIQVVALLYQEVEQIIVTNPVSFENQVNGEGTHHFATGKLTLSQSQLLSFIQYPETEVVDRAALTRQEHVLRLIKNYLLKNKNPFQLRKRFQSLLNQLQTDLSFKDLLSIYGVYSQVNEKMKRPTIE